MTEIIEYNQQRDIDRIIQTARETIARDLTPDQFALYAEIIRSTGLNPFQNQIHAIVRGDGRGGRRVVFQTGIDGLRLIAARTGEFEGEVGPQWAGEDGNWRDIWVSQKPPAAARVGVWRRGFREPVWGIAHYTEFVQRLNGEPTATWRSMPANMLAKCAEAQALRKAFPAETAGLYVPEEGGAMDRVDAAIQERQQVRRPAPAPQADAEGEVVASEQPKRSGPASFPPEVQALMRQMLQLAKAKGYPPIVYSQLIGGDVTQKSLAAWISQSDDPLGEASRFLQSLIEAEEQDDEEDIDEALPE